MLDSVELFRRDLAEIADRMGLSSELSSVVSKLTELYSRGLVKINHSAMEVVAAGYLVKCGYDFVDVEHKLDGDLVCDVYGVKGFSSVVIEVETGFTPPSNALDPNSYLIARISSKIARYSYYAEKMILAVPPYYTPPIPSELLKPPRDRCIDRIARLKMLLDKYYKNPPVGIKELLNARLHGIMIIYVDYCRVEVIDPQSYYDSISSIVRRCSSGF